MTRPETLTDIQRADRFYYFQQHAFGALIEGQTFGTARLEPTALRGDAISGSLAPTKHLYRASMTELH